MYCLMLCDSHEVPVPAGLLYYMKSNETISVLAKDNEIRGPVNMVQISSSFSLSLSLSLPLLSLSLPLSLPLSLFLSFSFVDSKESFSSLP